MNHYSEIYESFVKAKHELYFSNIRSIRNRILLVTEE